MKASFMSGTMPLQQISVKEDRHGAADDHEWKGQEPVYTTTGTTQAPPERCTSQASTLSNSYDICRICHCEGEGDAPLIAPCYCSGSLRYVHQACLQQWIKSSDIRCCELCKFQFIMYSKIKPITQWEQLELSALQRRRLMCSVLFHTMALTCVLWSLYVLIDRTLEELNRGLLEWPLWTKLIVVTIGLSGGIAFIYIQGKTYYQLCRRWRAFNRVIYVQNAPEKVALDSPSNPPQPASRPEGSSSLLGSGGCCGVQTESSVADVRENPREQNTSVDMHPGPATSSSRADKSEGSVCKEINKVEKQGWYHCPPPFESKDELPISSKSESVCNDDLSITSLDELTKKESSYSRRNSIDADMEPLPPPAAFVDSATNTEVMFENEKLGSKKFGRRASTGSGNGSGSPALIHNSSSATCSASATAFDNLAENKGNNLFASGKSFPCGQALTSSTTSIPCSDVMPEQKVNNSFLLGSSLTYGRPTRVGYPYMLSTFHPLMSQHLNVQQSDDQLGTRSCSSSSDECVMSSFLNLLQSESSDSWGQPVEDTRTERSGVRSTVSVPDTSSQPSCHSGSQSPLLSSNITATIKTFPKTK